MGDFKIVLYAIGVVILLSGMGILYGAWLDAREKKRIQKKTRLKGLNEA